MTTFSLQDWSRVSFTPKHALRCLKRGAIVDGLDQRAYMDLMTLIFITRRVAATRGMSFNDTHAITVFNRIRDNEPVSSNELKQLEDTLQFARKVLIGTPRDVFDEANNDVELYALMHDYKYVGFGG